MKCNQAIKNIEETKELTKSNSYTELIESNEKVLKSNAEINNKIDKLQSLLSEQEKKLQRKDEKLISLIISEIYSNKHEQKNAEDLLNSIYKKFKAILQ